MAKYNRKLVWFNLAIDSKLLGSDLVGTKVGACGTHSMRRAKVTEIYKKSGNRRAVQLLVHHTKMDGTVR